MQSRANKLTGPILCLVGPPGVGKTSLGKSIAKATGREFVRVSLGGVRDEAEIRGHRRTYIGSMPGKIIQSMRKAKASNPLFLLDEIDKMGADFRGDPSSALLEVLDPEQNHTFNDHYLEVDYDLSNVMFVTTANTLNIPAPLMDRMEIIRIAGYTEDEKVEIARKHLIPNAITKHGLDSKEWSIDDEALLFLIRRYTREAGVRNLERELSTLIRKAVKELMLDKKKKSVKVDRGQHPATISACRNTGTARPRTRIAIGVVTGLAWTEVGGELADHRRRHDARQGQDDRHGQSPRRDEGVDLGGGVLRALARGRLRHRAAAVREEGHPRARAGRRDAQGWSFGRRRHGDGDRLGDDRHPGSPRRRDDRRDHACAAACCRSAASRRSSWRRTAAASRRCLIPEENAKDLAEIGDNVKSALEIIPVSRMDEVLGHALTRKPEPIAWDEENAKRIDVPPPDGEAEVSPAYRALSFERSGAGVLVSRRFFCE